MNKQNLKQKFSILKIFIICPSIILLGHGAFYLIRLYNNNHDMHKLMKRYDTSLESFFCRPYKGSENYSGFCKFTATSKQVRTLTDRIKFKKINLMKSPDEILSREIDARKSSKNELQELNQALLAKRFAKDEICWNELSNKEKSKVDIYYQTTRTIGFMNKGEMEFAGYYYRMYILFSESLKKGCIMYLYPGFIGNE